MFDLIRSNQMNIMLALCSICAIMALLLLLAKYLPLKRKWILISMELCATFLLAFDRMAYMYSGDVSSKGYVMVRLSNFMVFFLTAVVVFVFNFYVADLLIEKGVSPLPKRINFVAICAVIEMILVVISQFTGLYYTFDDQNRYQRAPGFIICYIVPVICPILVYTVVWQHRKKLSFFIHLALILFVFVPVAMGVVQIFAYGISIVNMAMVVVSVNMYVFTVFDLNAEVEKAHLLEMEGLKEDRKSMMRLFDQTANAFVFSSEKNDPKMKGHSKRVADMARAMAEVAGHRPEECDEVYYTALLHNVDPDILAGIREYPFLEKGVRYLNEKYDGSGSPDGLKAGNIPGISRIVSLADAYDSMLYGIGSEEERPDMMVREAIIEESGSTFDPDYADVLFKVADSLHNGDSGNDILNLDSSLKCKKYRDKVTSGIDVHPYLRRISFESARLGHDEGYSAPSIILFDALDQHVHDNPKTIDAYHYIEYGEIWFDGKYVQTNSREMAVEKKPAYDEGLAENSYRIDAIRYEDHIRLVMESSAGVVEVTVALPDRTQSAYIGITGENCQITGIEVGEYKEKTVKADDIPRIADEISYIDRMESDLPNVQIDRFRSAQSDGITVKDRMRLMFHAMSLPTANLVWHCPFLILYYSEDRKINGPGYREYALIKINGEYDGNDEGSENSFSMKKDEGFPGWDKWKEKCKKGFECEVEFRKKGGKVTLITENQGISIENVTTIKDGPDEVYVCISGDQVAVTDIRIK